MPGLEDASHSPPISDYALIGDMRGSALVSRRGSIDWLCWPRLDSPAVFLRSLDVEKGGFCQIEAEGLAEFERRYEPETNIVETRFAGEAGALTLVDFMACETEAGIASRLVRIARCTQGVVDARFRVRPTFDFARRPAHIARVTARAIVFSSAGGRLGLAASHAVVCEGDATTIRATLRAGESLRIVLSCEPLAEEEASSERTDESLSRARDYWKAWSARYNYRGPYREAVLRSVLCLKLLTYAPTGAIVAAPTAGLPEAVPGDRNFDYRFTWLRDASFTTVSFLNLGYEAEAAAFLAFLAERVRADGGELRSLYAIDGAMPEEEKLDHLAGWRGASPVLIGNAASNQQQFDVYGEFLVALRGYIDRVGEAPAPLRAGLAELVTDMAEQILKRRGERDRGIWELRTDPQELLHTQAMLWVGLDRAASIASAKNFASDRVADWRNAAAELRAEFHQRGWNVARNAYVQSYGSEVLDASVMRAVLFGAIDADDPRTQATLVALDRELGSGDLIRRYKTEDGFSGEEGAFLVCSFWRVGCLALAGHTRPAQEMFERLLARANDVGLLPEEIDIATGEFRGNFPQGFTHMAVINHALHLQDCIERFGLRD